MKSFKYRYLPLNKSLYADPAICTAHTHAHAHTKQSTKDKNEDTTDKDNGSCQRHSSGQVQAE